MHDCIIDKTCIDRVNEHNTDCFQRSPLKNHLFVKCHLRSGSAMEINHENSSFYMVLYKSISVHHLVCCCIDNCDFQEFQCTVTCIKNLLLSNLNDKPQRHLTLNHIESNCYHPYNHLPHKGLPLWHVSAYCLFQFLL